MTLRHRGRPANCRRPASRRKHAGDVRGLCFTSEYRRTIVKLLRIRSAQNAILEIKQECAAVRLLQFGLTAGHLHHAAARAVDVADLAALHATNDGEPNEEDADNGGTEVGSTAAERVLHALVLARIPNEAWCKAKITDEGGVKRLCWVADGGASSDRQLLAA
jgi:hypothetical protein